MARDDIRDGWHTTWIFDSTTLEHLGQRTSLIRDTSMGKKGTLLSKSAVLERGVVDALRERPSAGKPSAGKPSAETPSTT